MGGAYWAICPMRIGRFTFAISPIWLGYIAYNGVMD
jgi:hypothetical protein